MKKKRVRFREAESLAGKTAVIPTGNDEVMNASLLSVGPTPAASASTGHVSNKNADPQASFHTYGTRRNSGGGAHQSAF